MTERRIPKDASEEARQVFHALWDALDQMQTGNRNLNQNRLSNVHDGLRSNDAVTKRQLDEAVSDVTATTAKAIKKVRVAIAGAVPSTGASGSGSGSGTGEFPPSNHAIDFGYYYVDSRFGQYAGAVRSYTNLAYIGPNNVLSPGAPPSDFQSALGLAIARLTGAGLNIVLDMEQASVISIDANLTAAAPYWSRVKYLVANGDWGGSKDALNSLVNTIKNTIAMKGLESRPVGVVWDGPASPGDFVNADSLDFVVVEAYYPNKSTGDHGSSQDGINTIRDTLTRLRNAVPATKRLGVVMQAYPFGTPTAPVYLPITPDLVDLQAATYLMVNEDTRVDFLLMFAYGRHPGTSDYPELVPNHRAIWNAINGSSGGTGGSGDGGGTGGGATDCGQGRPCCGGVTGSNCPRWCSGGDYEQQFFASQGAYIASAPATVVDPSNRNLILDSVAYMNGIVAQFNADNPTLIAIFEPGNDGKQAAVKAKGDATKSEHYKCWSGGGANTFVRYLYAATCYGARFEG